MWRSRRAILDLVIEIDVLEFDSLGFYACDNGVDELRRELNRMQNIDQVVRGKDSVFLAFFEQREELVLRNFDRDRRRRVAGHFIDRGEMLSHSLARRRP